MSMKKNAKEIINLILIAIMIFVLGFNFVLKPSVIVTNSPVIEKVFNSNRQDVIMAQNPNVIYSATMFVRINVFKQSQIQKKCL